MQLFCDEIFLLKKPNYVFYHVDLTVKVGQWTLILNIHIICKYNRYYLLKGGKSMSKPMNQSLNECLFFTVKKLDRILDKFAEDAFKPTGLSPTYGFIILAVYENPGITQKELAELLHTAPSTIARFVPKLEQKNLVYNEHSGRNTLTYLTDEGEALAAQVNEAWDKLHNLFSDVLGGKEHDELAIQISRVGDQFNISK
jgi:DNA-binding MarR family transcriptional regulator